MRAHVLAINQNGIWVTELIQSCRSSWSQYVRWRLHDLLPLYESTRIMTSTYLA